MGELEKEEALLLFHFELEDRFGPIPPQVADLLYVLRIKWLAQHLGYTKIIIKRGKLIAHFTAEHHRPYDTLPVISDGLKY